MDTSVLFRLARIKQGKAKKDQNREQSIRLRDSIYDLVRAGKLICPEANQGSEAERDHDLFSTVVNQLSLGVWAANSQSVRAEQERRVMRSFVNGLSTTTLPYDDAYGEDPISLLRTNLASDIFISVLETPTRQKIEEVRRSRNSIHVQWEQLRSELHGKGVTYEAQLETELLGEIQESIRQFENFALRMDSDQDASLNELSGYLRMSNLIETWQQIYGSGKEPREFGRFLASSYYKAIPSVEISAKLTAKVLTGTRRIKRGDAIDIEHISTMLPYSDMMVVDKTMKRLVLELGLDKKYSCTVCYIRDTHQMDTFFEAVASKTSII